MAIAKSARYRRSVIFPNPTSDIINISNSEQGKKIKIYNSFGHLIYDGLAPSHIDVSSWEDGVYFVKITLQDNKVKTEKLIVNK